MSSLYLRRKYKINHAALLRRKNQAAVPLRNRSLSTGQKKMLIKNFGNIFLLGKILFNIV
jgi:hypothetical protein